MKRIVFLMILLTICWVLPAVVLAAEPVGSVTFVKGKADITRPGQNAEPLVKGEDIYAGDIVRTKSNAKVEITFIDESIVRVAQKSRLQITEYMFEREERRSTLSLFRGKIQSLVKKVAGFSFGRARKNRFEIHTPTAVCGVRGTDFFTWFMNGETGTAFKEGQGYIYPANNPDLSRNINTNEVGYVVDPDAAPVVKPVTDADLEQHLEDTGPTEGEDDGEGGDGGDDPGAGLTMDGGDTGDTGDTGGTGGTDGTGALTTDDKVLLDLRETTTITGVTLFSEAASMSFLADGWIDGEIDDDTNQGPMTLTGLLSSEVPPGSTSIQNPVGGSLTVPDDTEVGAFDGEIAGVGGSWKGLMVSLYAQEPAEPAGSLYDVGYLYGALSSSQDLSTTGTAFSAEGTAYRSNPLGQVSLVPHTDPETGETEPLQDVLAAATTTGGFAGPMINADMTAGGPIFGYSAPMTTLETTSGRRLGIYTARDTETFSNTEGFNPEGLGQWTSIYGIPAGPYYVLGSLSVTDDVAGAPSPFGHLTLGGTATYMDHSYLGNANIWSRSTYDSGVNNLIAAGAMTLDPLAYSGYWNPGGETLYWNNFGQIGWAGKDDGIIGGRTVNELVVFGDFNLGGGGYDGPVMPGEVFLFKSKLDFTETSASGIEAYGYSAGNWKLPVNTGDTIYYGPNRISYGLIGGRAVALYEDNGDGNLGLMISNDLTGRFYPVIDDNGAVYDNIEMFNLVGQWGYSPRPSSSTYGNREDYGSIYSARLAGGFNGHGAIQIGLDDGSTSYFYNSETSSSPGWGIYNLKLGGYGTEGAFSGKPADNNTWSAKIGGKAEFGYEDDGFFIAEVKGSWNATEAEGTISEITGNAMGEFLSHRYLGTMGGPSGGPFYGTSTEGENDTWVGEGIGIYEPIRTLDYSGDWSSSGTLYDASSAPGEATTAGSDAGIVGFVKDGGFSYWAMGDFIDNLGLAAGVPYMQNSEIFATAVNPDTTGGGIGLLKGYSAGIALPPDGSTTGRMQSRMELIYFDHTGDMGFANGEVNAETYPDIELWSGQGGLTSQSMLSAGEVHDPGNLTYDTGDLSVAGLKGDFSGIGAIQAPAGFAADTVYLYDTDQMRSVPFGVYQFSVRSETIDFTGKPAADSSWKAAVGGTASMDYAWTGHWLGEVGGTWHSDGIIDGSLSGWYVTPIQMGDLSGDFSGLYETGVSSGGWIGQSVGRYAGERLGHEAITPNPVFAWNDGNGMIANGGSLTGLIGLLDSGAGNINLLGVGEYDLPGDLGGEFFWNASVDSGAYDNTPGQPDMTLKDGKIGGFIAGTGPEPVEGEYHSAGVGRSELIYFDENGNAGFSSGGVDADMFALDSTSGLWKLDGSLPTIQKNIAPIPSENLTDTYFMVENPLSAYMAGDFNGSGSISGLYANGGGVSYIKDLAAGRSLPFGSYLSLMQAPESIYHGYTGAPAEDSGFSATIGGTGFFDASGSEQFWLASVYGEFTSEDQRIEGVLGPSAAHDNAFGYYVTPIQMGSISGNFDGFFTPSGSDSGNWVAQSIGRFEGERVDFSGDWKSYSSTLYHNDMGHTLFAGEEWGRFGIKGEEFLAVGKFFDDDLLSGKKMMWNSTLAGNQLLNEDGVDDEFGIGTIASGFVAGLWVREYETEPSGALNGDGWFLVLDSGGNGKIIRADLDGRFFDMPVTGAENGMWYAKSDSVQTRFPDVEEQYKTGISGAIERHGSIGVGAMAGSFAGDGFSGFGGDVLPDSQVFSLTHSTKKDLPWGLYNIKLGAGGMSTRRPAGDASWAGVIAGGDAFFDDVPGDGGMFVASANGTWSDAGEIVGKVGIESAGALGKYMTSYQVGGFSDTGGGIGGDFTGINSSEGPWIGQSVGMFSGSLLALSGRFEGQNWEPDYFEDGYGGYHDGWFTGAGTHVDGLVGTIADPVVGSETSFYVMGHSIANTPILSVATDLHTDAGEKQYFTLLDFYSNGQALTGYGVGLYGDPSTEAFGYTSFSGLSGTHYGKVPVFDAEGRMALEGPETEPYAGLDSLFTSSIWNPSATISAESFSFSFSGKIRAELYTLSNSETAPGVHRTLGFGQSYSGDPSATGMYWAMTSIGRYWQPDGVYYEEPGSHAELYYLSINESADSGVMNRFSGELYGDPNSILTMTEIVPVEIPLAGWTYWGEGDDQYSEIPMGSLYHYSASSVGHDTGILAGYYSGDQLKLLAMGEFDVDPAYSVVTEKELVWATSLGESQLNSETEAWEWGVSGFTGGVWSGGTMDGKGFMVVEDPSGANPGYGILLADILGNYYELDTDNEVYHSGGWLATGDTRWIKMADSVASDLLANDEPDILTGGGQSYPFSGSDIYVSYAEVSGTNFQDEPWGVWGARMTGTQDSAADFSNWHLSLQNLASEIPYEPSSRMWVEVSGGRKPGEDRIIEGRAAGAWVELEDAMTGVFGGPVKGTFDPNSMEVPAWQAVAGGAFMETGKFLSMVRDDPGALDQLMIPRFEVGRTNLSLSETAANPTAFTRVDVNNMVFLAHSTGAPPSIWASGDVQGDFSSPAFPQVGAVTLTGAGFDNSVTFTVNNSNEITTGAGTWGALINGAGTVPGTTHPVQIDGGAAGGFDNGGFSGTGAGVVKPPPPAD